MISRLIEQISSFGQSFLPRQRTLYFLGDSHLRPLQHAYEMKWFGRKKCEFLSVGGATAVGLRHPTSKTQALLRFEEAVLPYNPQILPILHLGEVDCGFVIWHRADKYGESIEQQLNESLDAYLRFIDKLVAAGYRDLIVTAATLPTIRDGQLEGEVTHLRRSVTASQVERTELTHRYNQRLHEAVRERGLRFLDLTPDLINPATGLIDDQFRHPKTSDHHLNPDTGGRLWVRRLNELLKKRG